MDADSTAVHPHKPPGVAAASTAASTTAQGGNTLGVPAETHGATANGPTTRIPLSQRRVPPAKLNLTLDLSVTNLSNVPGGSGTVGSGSLHGRRGRGLSTSSQDHTDTQSSTAVPGTSTSMATDTTASNASTQGGVAASSGVVSIMIKTGVVCIMKIHYIFFMITVEECVECAVIIKCMVCSTHVY